MFVRNLVIFLMATFFFTSPTFAQFKDSDPEGIKMGQTKVHKWQAGVVVTASGGACKNINGYVPVPIDWPEQEVSIASEDVSPGVKIGYKGHEKTVRVMTINVSTLEAGQEVKALVTFEIRRNVILPPDNTDIYVLPKKKSLPPDVQRFLTPSPKIESTNKKIKDIVKEVGTDKEKAWEKVEAYYNWVRKKVKYKPGPLKGAIATLEDGEGDCEGMTSLFIAICRAAEIPARTVWVLGHCYPEFYLEDNKGEGHWFPCQISGSYEFGGIQETRPILQKGDNIQPISGDKKRVRYMPEYLTGTPEKNATSPRHRFVRELLPP